MATYELPEAARDLESLLAKARAGEEVVISLRGEPMARLVPCRSARRRQPDLCAGAIWVAPDFDAPLPGDALDAFDGR